MPLEIGTRVPPLDLRIAGGGAGREGKPAVLFFFKSTCPTCASTFPYVDALDHAFSDAEAAVLGVSQERLMVGHEFAGRCGVSVPLADDSGLTASSSFDVRNVPTTYLVDAEGRVQDVVIGLDKVGLNRIAGTLASWTGGPAPIIAPEDDGEPLLRPG